MTTEYQYTKSPVNSDSLSYEIKKDTGITTTLEYVNFDYPDYLRIYFNDDLSTDEKDVLDIIVANHEGKPLKEIISNIEYTNHILQTSVNISSCIIDGKTYNIDISRGDGGKWLESTRRKFEFARKGNANLMYIPLLGDLDDIDDVYTPEKDSTITGVYCRSVSGYKYKDIHIRKNGSNLFSFNYDDSLLYNNTNLDIDISKDDKIQIYIGGNGSTIKNTVCRVEYSWRYDL